jgi:hypothetical protein
MAVGKLKLGVAATGWVGCGVKLEGVEACSVASKSTGGVEAGRLHPAVKVRINKIHSILLCMFGFDGFKVALLTFQDFCTEAPAIVAGDFSVNGPIFLEAGHALHFGSYKTEVKLCMFRRSAFAAFGPFCLKGGEVKFGEFAKGQVKANDPLVSICLNAAKYLIKNGPDDLQFAHVPLFDDNE